MQSESKGAYHRLQGSVQGCQDNAPLPASWRATLDALIFLHSALPPELRMGGSQTSELQNLRILF